LGGRGSQRERQERSARGGDREGNGAKNPKKFSEKRPGDKEPDGVIPSRKSGVNTVRVQQPSRIRWDPRLQGNIIAASMGLIRRDNADKTISAIMESKKSKGLLIHEKKEEKTQKTTGNKGRTKKKKRREKA